MAEMEAKRITLEQVIEAYEKTGLKPIFGSFKLGDDCGCPLTALAFAITGEIATNGNAVVEVLMEEGYGYLYLKDFYLGVDRAGEGRSYRLRSSPGYVDGWEVGSYFGMLSKK